MPWASISRRSAPRLARSCSSLAARVAATVVAMPPAWYAVPAIRAANSALRSPANTRWACESTKPGRTARPPQSAISSAAGACRAGPAHATRPSSTTSAASARAANGPGPAGRAPSAAPGALVTSSPMFVISVLTVPHASRSGRYRAPPVPVPVPCPPRLAPPVRRSSGAVSSGEVAGRELLGLDQHQPVAGHVAHDRLHPVGPVRRLLQEGDALGAEFLEGLTAVVDPEPQAAHLARFELAPDEVGRVRLERRSRRHQGDFQFGLAGVAHRDPAEPLTHGDVGAGLEAQDVDVVVARGVLVEAVDGDE